MTGYRTRPFQLHSHGLWNHPDTYYPYCRVFLLIFNFFWRQFLQDHHYTACVVSLHVGLSNETIWVAFLRTLETFWPIIPLFSLFAVIFNCFSRMFPRDHNYMAQVDSLHVGLSNGIVLGAFPRTVEPLWHILLQFCCIWVICNYFLKGICVGWALHGPCYQSVCRAIKRGRFGCIPADFGTIPTAIIPIVVYFQSYLIYFEGNFRGMSTTWPVLSVCMSGYQTRPFWLHSRGLWTHSDRYYPYFSVFLVIFNLFWREFPRDEHYTARVVSLHVGLSNEPVLVTFPRTLELFWHLLSLF